MQPLLTTSRTDLLPVPLGRTLATPAVLAALSRAALCTLLDRHALGDWGDIDADDVAANDQALQSGARLLSAYETPAGRVWVLTEADRSTTTVLFASEY